MPYSIMLDAGHGGRDPGAVYNGRQEKDDALALTLAVGEILQDRGIDVMYTRTTDVYESPYQKAMEANAAGVDFFYRLGGVEEIVPSPEEMRDAVARHVEQVEALKRAGHYEQTGPWSRGALGAERGGRTTRPEVLRRMTEEFASVSARYLI